VRLGSPTRSAVHAPTRRPIAISLPCGVPLKAPAFPLDYFPQSQGVTSPRSRHQDHEDHAKEQAAHVAHGLLSRSVIIMAHAETD